ncbi:hypothetical protein BCR34DRAFT_281678 [Clohesyomyces aquaticus]|uniref:Secreted protein n=1 Tax=Clohesyomyces aquaticus TaxID=1231657 RepID=A0A1Y1ZRX5_9PLEO|nr:hypothetical protein BCR34DRAFT_281678 [Clohesyomyces aquaticus]
MKGPCWPSLSSRIVSIRWMSCMLVTSSLFASSRIPSLIIEQKGHPLFAASTSSEYVACNCNQGSKGSMALHTSDHGACKSDHGFFGLAFLHRRHGILLCESRAGREWMISLYRAD